MKVSYSGNNIVIIAMTKSASTYIKHKISNTLNYRQAVHRDWKNQNFRVAFKRRKNIVLRLHIAPTAKHLAALRLYTNKNIVVHVRDPRQALLSSVHHATRKAELLHIAEERKHMSNERIQFLQYFKTLDQKQKIDVLINNIFMDKIRWISDWCLTKEIEDLKPEGLRIMVTSYDDFLKDEDQFFDKIYNFFAINKRFVRKVAVKRDISVNFRKGEPDEWRQVLSPEQIALMNEMMPVDMLNRFGWEY